MIEQLAAVMGHRLQILAPHAFEHLARVADLERFGFFRREERIGTEYVKERGRRIADRPVISVMHGHLFEQVFVRAARGFFHAAPHRAPALGCQGGFRHTVEGDAVVPEFERSALRVLRHPVAVFADRRHHQTLSGAPAQAHMTRGHHEARGEALQVPFEWPDRHFVEVIQIEHELPLRRGEPAEIHQMTIAADGHGQAGVVNLAEIVSLQDGGATKKRERRCGHAPVAQWHEVLDPAFAALPEKLDWIAVQFPDRAMA